MKSVREHEDVHFEHSDLNVKATLIAGACVLVGMWLLTALLYFYFTALVRHRAAVSVPAIAAQEAGSTLPPQPRLQASPREDLKAFVARENWGLTHYHWLDKDKGIVAIPITEAIRLTAQRGIPRTNAAPNPTLTPPSEGTRQTGFEGKVEPEPR